jgi:uncharacterized membrane protein
MKNGKTTLAGIASILTAAAAVLNSWPTPDWGSAVAAIIAGLGLIFAADARKDG